MGGGEGGAEPPQIHSINVQSCYKLKVFYVANYCMVLV